MYEPITIERLDNYLEIEKEYNYLLHQKSNLIKKIGTLHGIDYSKIKVTTGNGSKSSEEEHYVMRLQKINTKLSEYESWLKPEKEIIKTQIARIKKWNYRKILVLRYIEKWKWSEIIQDFFEFEDDYEDEKTLKYKDTIMRWNRQALAELEKVSNKPYVKTSKQLVIEEGNNERIIEKRT